MANIKVGKPDTTHDAPAHIPGVASGNTPGGTVSEPGLIETGEVGAGRPTMRSTARKSTGINADRRNPIDPNSPNLPPA